jgi:hypothetical protein
VRGQENNDACWSACEESIEKPGIKEAWFEAGSIPNGIIPEWK